MQQAHPPFTSVITFKGNKVNNNLKKHKQFFLVTTVSLQLPFFCFL